MLKKIHILLILIIILEGCASLPTDYPKTNSTALEGYGSTSLGQISIALEEGNPNLSGFTLLRYGRYAFSHRLSLIDLAEKTIDLQIYIWDNDETGLILAERVLQAADRGVRVRLLVDDMGFGGTDEGLAIADSHPNIEVRVFNPFASRGNRMWDFLFDFGRVNHRMHNKMLISDNSFAIVGGRNIGNHYFGVDPETNFRDLDIAATGPIVRDTSKVFDHFWASEVSIPASVLVDSDYSRQDFDNMMQRMRERIDIGDYPYALDNEIESAKEIMPYLENKLIWAPGKIVWNSPEESMDDEQGSEMITALKRKLQQVNHSFIIESAYFVANDFGVAEIKRLINKGVDVRVLTNSLASNDVLAAHAGHAEYRKQLIEAGVEMYELRNDSGVIKKGWVGESRAGLHTKAMVFDEESLFVGSFNLDPRSANINTEGGIYVESPELAKVLLMYMEEGITPENSYRVTLDENGKLAWTTIIDGKKVTYYQDPLSTFGQRFFSGFIQLLPVESQL